MKTEKMKTEKPCQIIMNHNAHSVLKFYAKQLNIKIGEMTENLLISLQARVDRVVEKAKISSSSRTFEMDARISRLILMADVEGWSSEKLDDEILNIQTELAVEKYTRFFLKSELTFDD